MTLNARKANPTGDVEMPVMRRMVIGGVSGVGIGFLGGLHGNCYSVNAN